MRGFHFGKIVRKNGKNVGAYALHIQCPWRIESETAIVTGSQDWYVFAGEAEGVREDPDSWDTRLRRQSPGKPTESALWLPNRPGSDDYESYGQIIRNGR